MRFRHETKNWKKRLCSRECVILEGREAGRKEEKGEDNWHVEDDGILTHLLCRREIQLVDLKYTRQRLQMRSELRWSREREEKGGRGWRAFILLPLSPQRRNRSLSVLVLLDLYSCWTKDGEEAEMKSKGKPVLAKLTAKKTNHASPGFFCAPSGEF